MSAAEIGEEVAPAVEQFSSIMSSTQRGEEPRLLALSQQHCYPGQRNLLWARTFDTIEELRAALVEFARHYNETWRVGYR